MPNSHRPDPLLRDEFDTVADAARREPASVSPIAPDADSGPRGVHWHVQQDVEFTSADPRSQSISSVTVNNPDGTKTQYIAANKVGISADATPDLERLADEYYEASQLDPRRAEQLRGEGDAERNRIFAEAYSKDPDFFGFYRSMQAYEQSFKAPDKNATEKQGDTRMIISPDSDFFRFFMSPQGTGKAPGTTAPAR